MPNFRNCWRRCDRVWPVTLASSRMDSCFSVLKARNFSEFSATGRTFVAIVSMSWEYSYTVGSSRPLESPCSPCEWGLSLSKHERPLPKRIGREPFTARANSRKAVGAGKFPIPELFACDFDTRLETLALDYAWYWNHRLFHAPTPRWLAWTGLRVPLGSKIS